MNYLNSKDVDEQAGAELCQAQWYKSWVNITILLILIAWQAVMVNTDTWHFLGGKG